MSQAKAVPATAGRSCPLDNDFGPDRPTRALLTAARVVSIAEATSFLMLLVATTVKYGADQPLGVTVLGPIHGGLFLAYCGLVLAVGFVCRWRATRTLLALGASVLPVAPFLVERAWLRSPQPAPAAPNTPNQDRGSVRSRYGATPH